LCCLLKFNTPKNEVELITMVEQTYEEYPSFKINMLFVTLQTIFNSIIEQNGNNQFKLLHMNKERLERDGRLPVALPVSAWI
jgi:hypothetical protein